MADFLYTNLDYIFFFYGLSFILLAVICRALYQREEKCLPWQWLMLFGITHGLNEWADMAALFQDSEVFSWIRLLVMSLSFLFLFEFGRAGLIQQRGKGPGRWIYIPLFILVGGSGFFGLNGLNAGVRYAFGFPGALLSGGVIYLAGSKTPIGKNLLKCAGFFLALYAIASGAVVNSAPFFPATYLNAAWFRDTAQLPIQLVRAILAVTLSVLLWFYARRTFMAFSPQAHFLQQKITYWTVVGLLLILVGGGILTNIFGEAAHREFHSRQTTVVRNLTEHIDVRMNVVTQLVQILATSRVVEAALIAPNDLNAIEAANHEVDRFSACFESSVVYLLNLEGTVIATSNRKTTSSFLGKSFSFRPYFQEAVKGENGSYCARGTVSMERGYYASHPVYDGRGHIIGVAVCKIQIDEVGQYFRGHKLAFLIDPHGIIFISSQPDMIFKSLWPLTNGEIREVKEMRQFGDGPFEPVLNKKIVSGDRCEFGGETYEVATQPILLAGWKTVYLASPIGVSVYRMTGIALTLILCLFLVVGFVVWDTLLYTSSKIEASEARYRQLIEGAPSWISMCDASGLILSVNRGGASALGLAEKEIVDHNLLDLLSGDQKEETLAAVHNAARGVKQSLLGFYEGKDHQRIVWQMVFVPLAVPTTRGNRFILIAYDITEKQRAIEKLRRSNMEEGILNALLQISLKKITFKEQLQQILEKIYTTPWLPVLPRGAIFLANESKTELEMFVEKNLPQSLLHLCKNVPFGTCLCGLAAQEGEIIFSDQIDERHTNRYDGMPAHGHYIVPLKSANELLGVLDLYLNPGHQRNEAEVLFLESAATIIVNIIKRYRADEALAALRHKLELILDSAGEGIIGLGLDGKHVFVNRDASTLLGRESGEMINNEAHAMWFHTKSDGTPQKWEDSPIFNSLKKGSTAQNIEAVFWRKDGTSFPVIYTSAPLREGDKIIGVVVAFRDITELQKLQKKLLSAEKLASIGILAGGTAHEINNPLTVVIGYAQMISMRSTDPKLTEDANSIHTAALRCKKIVDNLLKFSRGTDTKRFPCNINEIATKAIEAAKSQQELHNIVIETNFQTNMPDILADKDPLSNAIQQIISNAADAISSTKQPGTIKISTNRRGSAICVRITDSGPGILEDCAQKIFDPFFSTKEVGKGTGLGLSIAYGIVREHLGDLRLVDHSPGNTTFEIELPCNLS